MAAPTLANRLATYATGLTFEKLTKEAVHETKRRFIDSFATAVGAMPSEAYAIAKKCACACTGNPGASILGGGQTSIEWATFVNGLLIRYLDFNDTYLCKEPAHPSDNLAAVLAVGEAVGAKGRDLITAAVLAYEIQCRFCDAASLRKHGVDHVTYGAISSAVAAGKLMKLDATKLTHAVGIAGVCNVALRQTRSGELSMWKGCAFANAARNGVFAAMLAAEGLTGPAPIFEGDLGFFKLVAREPFDPAPFGGEFGNQDGFMINKTYIKFWPAEYHSQSAIDAALQLRSELNGDVSSVTGHRHRHVRGELQHHRQVSRSLGTEDPRDGRPQPALLHRRGALRRRRDAGDLRREAFHRPGTSSVHGTREGEPRSGTRFALSRAVSRTESRSRCRTDESWCGRSSSRAATPATR